MAFKGHEVRLMNQFRGSWRWQLLASAVIFGGIATSGTCALGQVAEDTTLGAESSIVTSPIPGGFLIDGGATRGTNLFHSFSEFSVPTNGIAYFDNALTIQNIISRVTGASISNIDGVIAANGTANVFLINPNGIVFGSNASLNIGGVFFSEYGFKCVV
jgi:filamentous hemagglutinin family protein